MSTANAAVSPASPAPSEPNTAVRRCLEAWANRLQMESNKGANEYARNQLAATAYRAAMPELTSQTDIRDFIACTARGLLIGVINDKIATKLLYAAQVASGNVQRAAKSERAAKPEKEKIEKA